MKFIKLLTILALAALIGCSEESSDNNSLGKLNINDVVQFIPKNDYMNNSTLIFKNAQGLEKSFTISTSSNELNKVFGEKTYKAENLEINLIDPNTDEYRLNINVGSNYTTSTESVSYISCGLLNDTNDGLVPVIDMVLENSRLNSHTIHAELVLNNKSFTDVHQSIDLSSQVNGFSNLYYNSEFGIIGFTDELNELWVFEKYEN